MNKTCVKIFFLFLFFYCKLYYREYIASFTYLNLTDAIIPYKHYIHNVNDRTLISFTFKYVYITYNNVE